MELSELMVALLDGERYQALFDEAGSQPPRPPPGSDISAGSWLADRLFEAGYAIDHAAMADIFLRFLIARGEPEWEAFDMVWQATMCAGIMMLAIRESIQLQDEGAELPSA